jgi:hypothetical protein
MAFELVADPNALPGVNKRVWAGTVTLSSGTATIDHSADLPGVDRIPGNELDAAPVVVATAEADDAVFVDTQDNESTTLSDGSGANSNDVQVVVYEQ